MSQTVDGAMTRSGALTRASGILPLNGLSRETRELARIVRGTLDSGNAVG